MLLVKLSIGILGCGYIIAKLQPEWNRGHLVQHIFDFSGAFWKPWRPPGNRAPTDNEISLMKPFLMRHIEIAAPKILVAVGGSASKAILDIAGGILRHRGVWKEIRLSNTLAIPTIATLHPAYLLRAPNQKRLAWEDLKSIRSKLQELNV